jgi:hypothetical protein
MRYRHLPLHLRGESQTNVVLGEAREDCLHTLVGVVAGHITDLDNATLDLSRLHGELEEAHFRLQPSKLSSEEGIHPKPKSLPWLCPRPARGFAMENQDLSQGYSIFISHIVISSILR